ncbi:MAG: hypothetical protein K0M63_05990 [Weeksellaceae bacterium]|nr:hypothetical protein [Weeksellaceae bacterium]
MNNFKINKPCNESWDEMSPETDGKFCSRCSRKVWDFTGSSPTEILKTVNEYQGLKICGLILKTRVNIAAGLLVVVSFTAASCAPVQNPKNSALLIVNNDILKIKGKVTASDHHLLRNAEVKIVTRNKLYRGRLDDELNFEIEVPESEIKEHNIIKIDYQLTSTTGTGDVFKDYSLHILSKKDLFANKSLVAHEGLTEIGEVVIVTPEPTDYYYFDGKSISKNKFNQIKQENPHYESLFLEDEIFKNLITKYYSGTVYLLYSN